MFVSQMFPSRYLDAQDLRALNPGYTVVTIEKIDYKTAPSRNMGEVEIDYFLKFVEFKKWMKFKKFNAMVLKALLGDDARAWPGQTIQIFPVMINMPDAAGGMKGVWVINVDIQRPTTKPNLPANHDITGLAAQALHPGVQQPGLPPGSTVPAAAGQGGRLGIETAAAIFGALIERNRTWENFLAYMKDIGQQALVSGLEPPECSYAVREWAMKFCKLAGRVNPKPSAATLDEIKSKWRPPPAAVGDVIDKKSGELLKSGAVATGPAAAASASAPAAAEHQEIDEEDIPF